MTAEGKRRRANLERTARLRIPPRPTSGPAYALASPFTDYQSHAASTEVTAVRMNMMPCTSIVSCHLPSLPQSWSPVTAVNTLGLRRQSA